MQTSCVVDEKFVPKVGMIFKTLEEAGKFYKHYSKLASFSTKIRNTTRDGDKIKNQLIVCSREGRWKSKISPILKTNPSAGLNCLAKIYVHIMKDVGLWIISKIVLNHSRPCCPDQAEMLKQHKENISEEDDAKEFGKYLVRIKEKNQNFFFELNLEGDHCIKHAFWANARSRATFDYFRDVVSFDTTYNTNRYLVHSNIFLMFSSFVGVNHHGQLTLLGCVLMKNEDIQSFKWLFECWLRCMEGKAPKELYEDCHIWISVYLDHHFWAGMRSTQRSETIEAQYTHEKFKQVQAQFRGKVNCITRSMHSTLGFTTYEVIEQVSNSKFNKFVVTYNAVSRDVKCHCLLFESRGILCRHSLSVLSFERVDNVALKYILER
ncbi:hypothetical protein Ahy_B03g066440 [Arachis hypogaea]|uniref:SWIM-type domain-containing protein n=1 Tax=Arachis hypogaea TaxID=3818 RepID=A0A445A3Z6_ARAHY|nr:hypothetical protein Ahy_B03g066440 [Arachis hypogaea]